jgi:hypothetical protein
MRGGDGELGRGDLRSEARTDLRGVLEEGATLELHGAGIGNVVTRRRRCCVIGLHVPVPLALIVVVVIVVAFVVVFFFAQVHARKASFRWPVADGLEGPLLRGILFRGALSYSHGSCEGVDDVAHGSKSQFLARGAAQTDAALPIDTDTRVTGVFVRAGPFLGDLLL